VSARHTPGPWFVDQQGAPTVRTANGSVVCGVPANCEDARLIAAAPDLLAALKSLGRCVLDQVESDIGRECRSRDLPKEWHTAAAAITKAEAAQ
jgi:hypothetical protein